MSGSAEKAKISKILKLRNTNGERYGEQDNTTKQENDEHNLKNNIKWL